MNKDLKEITDKLHDEAQARYALALNADYHAAAAALSQTSIVALRHYALAVLGSPYLRVTNRRWNESITAWLMSLAERYAAQQESDD
jgi:hypothetical protein